jgi:hypothetical protein
MVHRALLMSILLLLAQSRVPPAVDPADPASDLVRVRAFLTTTSTSVDLTVAGAEWANAVSPDSSFRAIIDGHTLHVTRKTAGEADVPLEMVLGSVHAGTSVSWTVAPVASGASALELYNVNGAVPRAVDRFDAGSVVGHFTSPADVLRAGGPLPQIPRVKHHLVLAFFYPWWTNSTWSSNGQIYDNPVPEYSTDDPADLRRLMTAAKSTGLDALVMSWSGKDFNGGLDHQRMLRCLAAADAAGFKLAALLETTVANPQHRDGDADPDTVLAWLTDIVDQYASQSAYLRVDGRPVVMAYAAQRLTQAGWVDALRRLRASGRDVLLIGEGSNNTRLGAFDGQFYYPSNQFTGDTIQAFDRAQSLNVRTYHLLPTDTVGRRVWVATVSPGYDDTHLNDGRVARVTDRASGAYYKAQWQAALDNRADWVVVTSWNEYLENTEIEATRVYGDLYVSLTKSRSVLFRQLNPVAVPRQR